MRWLILLVLQLPRWGGTQLMSALMDWAPLLALTPA